MVTYLSADAGAMVVGPCSSEWIYTTSGPADPTWISMVVPSGIGFQPTTDRLTGKDSYDFIRGVSMSWSCSVLWNYGYVAPRHLIFPTCWRICNNADSANDAVRCQLECFVCCAESICGVCSCIQYVNNKSRFVLDDA
jgi:hypothetical protein